MAVIHAWFRLHEPHCTVLGRKGACEGCEATDFAVRADFDPGRGSLRDRIARARATALDRAQRVMAEIDRSDCS